MGCFCSFVEWMPKVYKKEEISNVALTVNFSIVATNDRFVENSFNCSILSWVEGRLITRHREYHDGRIVPRSWRQ